VCVQPFLKDPQMNLKIESVWTNKKAPQFCELNADQSADVVVIGAGIVGVLHAILLAQKGRKVVLIDAGRVMDGISKAQGGTITRTFDARYDNILDHEGATVLQERFWAAALGQKWLIDTVRQVGGDCDLRVGDSDYGAYSNISRSLTSLHGLWRGIKVANAGAELLENQQMSAANPFGAMMRFRDEGSYDPVRFALNALAHFRDHISVYENSPVMRIRATSRGVMVRTSKARISAEHVILATGEPTIYGKGLKRLFKYEWCQSVVLKYDDELALSENRNYFDTPWINTFRKLDSHTLLLLGAGPNLKKGEPDEEYAQALIAFARKHKFGKDFHEVRRWSHHLVDTKDGMPIAGRLSQLRFWGRVTLALGGGGTGNVNGALMAIMNVSNIVDGSAVYYDRLFNVSRFAAVCKILGVAPQHVRRLGSIDANGVILVDHGRLIGIVHNDHLQPKHRALQGPSCVTPKFGVIVVKDGVSQSCVHIKDLP
jgi:glycine/D-amino acid oxidase-like deaminating enzyme